jgi:hypothetical protein
LHDEAFIKLKFKSKEHLKQMKRFFHDESELCFTNNIEEDDKTIKVKGNDVEQLAHLLSSLNTREYILPTDVLCKFAYYFEKYTNESLPQLNNDIFERLYKMFGQQEKFKELDDKLSKMFSQKEITEPKKTAIETYKASLPKDNNGNKDLIEIKQYELEEGVDFTNLSYDFSEHEVPSNDDSDIEEEEDANGWGREKPESNIAQPPSDELLEEELSDKLKEIKHLEEINEYNEKAYQKIKEQCAKLEKIIANRNKITNAIRYILKKIAPLLVTEKIFGRDAERLSNGAASLSTSSAPMDKLDGSVNLDEFSKKIDGLIERAKKSITVEEHARDLLQWAARKFTSAYKRAVSESPSETQAIASKVVNTRLKPGTSEDEEKTHQNHVGASQRRNSQY